MKVDVILINVVHMNGKKEKKDKNEKKWQFKQESISS